MQLHYISCCSGQQILFIVISVCVHIHLRYASASWMGHVLISLLLVSQKKRFWSINLGDPPPGSELSVLRFGEHGDHYAVTALVLKTAAMLLSCGPNSSVSSLAHLET